MKVTYSLQEFRNEILAIAKEVDQTYATVKAEIDHAGQLRFSSYINGYEYAYGNTVEESVKNMKKQALPHLFTTTYDVEVEVEVEKEEELVEL
jgi:hypothetical protein